LAYHYQHQLNFLISLLTLLCTILLQISSNLANDYLDFLRGIDNNLRTGPVRATQSKLISLKQMKAALILTLSTAFLMGIYLMVSGGLPIIIIGVLSLYFAYGYTGGPFPLSYNALGEISAFLFFGPIAVLGSFYLQIHLINGHALLLGCGAGSIAATILAINNLRDMKSDSLTTKKTIALIFGETFQRQLCLCLIATSVVIIFIHYFILGNLLVLLCLIVPILFKSNWSYIYSGPINENLNLTLAKTAQYLFVYSLALSITLVVL
jgi:1,4-dihydroxy-2-naphthoate octaprenyltransferase